jgi:precorrin-2/cobalt-factor-2 C20-methyltransferase
MKGTLYCVGLGPGDPDLVTLKTLRLLQKCDIIALPQNKGGEGMAATILRRLFEQEGMDFSTKTCCPLSFPMTYDEKALANAHEDSAITLKTYLDDGNDVVLATIGCPTIYATSLYVAKILERQGYTISIIPGVSSFSACAATLGKGLCEKDEALLIMPAGRKDIDGLLEVDANKVIMKLPRQLDRLKETLQNHGQLEQASFVSRCTLDDEKVYPQFKDAEGTGYFSIVVVSKGGE